MISITGVSKVIHVRAVLASKGVLLSSQGMFSATSQHVSGKHPHEPVERWQKIGRHVMAAGDDRCPTIVGRALEKCKTSAFG